MHYLLNKRLIEKKERKKQMQKDKKKMKQKPKTTKLAKGKREGEKKEEWAEYETSTAVTVQKDVSCRSRSASRALRTVTPTSCPHYR